MLKILLLTNFISQQQKLFAVVLKRDDLVNKTAFINKLTSFNKPITSNKTTRLEVQRNLNIVITKDYKFFLDENYIKNNDGSQNLLPTNV